VLTGFKFNDDFSNFRVFTSLRHGDTDIESIPESDFFTETFNKDGEASLGYEWTTGSKVARTVGAGSILSYGTKFAFSHLAILGTPLISCFDKIKQLVENEDIAFYDSVVVPYLGQYSQILDIRANPATGEAKDLLGAQYEDCISLSLSLDDRGTPIPDFMSFDRETRIFTATPTPYDVGLYKLFVNLNYVNQIDPEKPLPNLHSH